MNLSSLSSIRLSLALVSGAVLAAIAAVWLAPVLVPWLLVFAGVAVGGAVWALRRLEHDVSRTIKVCHALRDGRFKQRLTGITDSGAIGELMWAVNDMTDHVDAFIREASASMECISRNQYHRRILANGMKGNLGHGAKVINHAADVVAAKIDNFANIAASLEKSLQEVASEVVGTVETLTNAARTMGDNVTSTNRETDNIVSVSALAQERVQQTVATAESINNVISIIHKIASQTNLLALNATIEAARAGKAGQGFAVVAGEVKTLSDQTAKSTMDITDKVQTLQHVSDDISHVFFGREDETGEKAVQSQDIVTLIGNIQSNMNGIRQSSEQVLQATDVLATHSTARIRQLVLQMNTFMDELRKIA